MNKISSDIPIDSCSIWQVTTMFCLLLLPSQRCDLNTFVFVWQMSKLTDSLSCAVCLEPYNLNDRLPRSLSCFHSFCASCLATLGKAIIRPTCRKATSVPLGGLSPNFALVDVLEAMPKGKDEKKSAPKCQICENADHDAVHRCLNPACAAEVNCCLQSLNTCLSHVHVVRRWCAIMPAVSTQKATSSDRLRRAMGARKLSATNIPSQWNCIVFKTIA